jgi:hypothetical protein
VNDVKSFFSEFILLALVAVLACCIVIGLQFLHKSQIRKCPEGKFRNAMMLCFAILGCFVWAPWLSSIVPRHWVPYFGFPELCFGVGLFVGYWVSKISAVFLGYESEEKSDDGQ